MELQYLTDVRGKKKAVVIPIKMYEKMIDKLDELEDIRLYNEAKKNEESYIPIDEAFKIIEEKRKKKKDPAKMSRKDFFAMIDIKMSMEEMQDLLVIMQRENSPTSPFSEALERIKKYREKNNL